MKLTLHGKMFDRVGLYIRWNEPPNGQREMELELMFKHDLLIEAQRVQYEVLGEHLRVLFNDVIRPGRRCVITADDEGILLDIPHAFLRDIDATLPRGDAPGLYNMRLTVIRFRPMLPFTVRLEAR